MRCPDRVPDPTLSPLSFQGSQTRLRDLKIVRERGVGIQESNLGVVESRPSDFVGGCTGTTEVVVEEGCLSSVILEEFCF